MGTIFEELVRRFNEENTEEAGEHWTPRDAVKLMAQLVFQPIADDIDSGTYLLYDGACGTGGMLTVAEETVQGIAAERGKAVSTHLYGQEINAETYAICKADLLLKGEGDAADNIVGGPGHSTLSNDAFPSHEFDFMLSNPPYGKSWKTDLERMGGKTGMRDPHLYHTSAYMTEVNKYSRGIVADRNRLYWEDFKQMPAPCPPPDEQCAIADYIDREANFTIDQIRMRQEQIRLAEEYRTRLIADVVLGKLDVRKAAPALPRQADVVVADLAEA